jgi:hypothetical protein
MMRRHALMVYLNKTVNKPVVFWSALHKHGRKVRYLLVIVVMPNGFERP